MTALACFAATLLATASAQAQGTVKIGVIMSYSGQFADTGTQIGNGIKLYMKEHGDTVAGKKIELVPKDNGGIAPDVAKRLTQEAIVREKVDILAGFAGRVESVVRSSMPFEAWRRRAAAFALGGEALA